MPRYTSYRSYLKKKFGKPVLKIPVNGGFSCPNRDGTISVAGCSFCDNRSFSPVAHNENSAVNQLVATIGRVQGKYDLYIPYLQPFSNTYGTIAQLQSVYEQLISVPNVCGLAIGTRPDCFSEEIYSYLGDLAKRTYISVELGLQSSSDQVLVSSNRGHTVNDFVNVVNRLTEMHIETVAHCMLGLPGDREAHMFDTARLCATLPLTGVKIHQLMIIEGTALETPYQNGEIELFMLEHYTQVLCNFIKYLRPDQHIHRLMADSKKEHGLIAPLWSEHKAEAMRYILDYMEKNDVVQGSLYNTNP